MICRKELGVSQQQQQQQTLGLILMYYMLPPYFYTNRSEVLVTQLCLTLCNPMDWGSPDSSVHGILQARILEWVAILCGNSICEFLRNLHTVFHDQFCPFLCRCGLVAKSCLTLYDSVDGSPPGSSVHWISQARILEEVAISFSRDLLEPVSPALHVDSLLMSHWGSPF